MSNKTPEILELPKKPIKDSPIISEGNLPFLDHLNQIEGRQKTQYDSELTVLRKQRIQQIQTKRGSKLIVYYGLDLLDHKDAEEIFEVLTCCRNSTKLDLFLLSPGGFSSAAFKIARMFQECTTGEGGRFAVLVPYYAKSAATILALGADEIVMGLPSELGPIDPQLPTKTGSVPLLALKDAIDYIKAEVAGNPETAQLFWPLVQQIQLMSLGQFEREISSAKQYAEQLLLSRMFKDSSDKATLAADRLTSWYKNHGHIIDRIEARDTLGLNIIDAEKELWDLMWQLHKLYDLQLRRSVKEKGYQVKIIETLEIMRMRPINTTSNLVSKDGDLDAGGKN